MSFLHYYYNNDIPIETWNFRCGRLLYYIQRSVCVTNKFGRLPTEAHGSTDARRSLAVSTFFCKRFHLQVQGKTTLTSPTYMSDITNYETADD